MTSKESQSCIKTIEMLRRLAYNIHGIMDVIDTDNCEKIIKALEQEPCDDAINRQAAIEAFKPRGIAEDVWQECNEYKVLMSLPSVNPQQKTGHWIIHSDYDAIECDKCGRAYSEYDYNAFNYCPNCGVRMESDHKCHTCKHYMSGEYDGSCDSYICEHYSNWESEGKK